MTLVNSRPIISPPSANHLQAVYVILAPPVSYTAHAGQYDYHDISHGCPWPLYK